MVTMDSRSAMESVNIAAIKNSANTDISKLQKVINWKPEFSLKDGLEKTYNIMKEYHLKKSS